MTAWGGQKQAYIFYSNRLGTRNNYKTGQHKDMPLCLLCLLCQRWCCVLRATVCPDILLKLLDWQESSCCFSVGYSWREKSKYSWGLQSLGLGNVWINMSAFCRWCHLSDFGGICIDSDKLSTTEEPKFTWRKIHGASNKWGVTVQKLAAGGFFHLATGT